MLLNAQKAEEINRATTTRRVHENANHKAMEEADFSRCSLPKETYRVRLAGHATSAERDGRAAAAAQHGAQGVPDCIKQNHGQQR